MASIAKAEGIASHEPVPEAGAPKNQAEAKKAINHATGDPLTENQLTRAASEYMLALRPQPGREQMEIVLRSIAEHDDKGDLKHKCKSTDEVPALVDTALKS
jgi:hypothetical protein